MSRAPFYKTMGEFDRIEIRSHGNNDWLDIIMHVGHDVETVKMTLRSDEAVRDLHYALGRYLAQLPSS